MKEQGQKVQLQKFQAVKGMRDILPPDSALWNRVEQTAREVFATYGYGEIRLPILEQTELFARSVGTDTDVVSKEMYTFEDRPYGIDETARRYLVEQRGVLPFPLLSLRPEATASVARAYIEQGMQTLPGSVKLYYIGPMFRHERPQKGRYRQFYQIGAEVLGGSDHPAIDAELIEMLMAFFDRASLAGARLQINSIGDKNCRPAYVAALRAALEKVRERLGPDSQRRIETNPLRVLDSKLPEEQEIIAGLPRIADHLCPECKEHYVQLKAELALRGVAFEENWRLVRGFDYYMRTTFEITAPGLGSQDAVCGGGRYDGLVELLGGPPTKGIGFAIGTDRLILSLEQAAQSSEKGPEKRAVEVYVAWMGVVAYPAAVALARKLREQGIATEIQTGQMKFGKSLGLADRLGSRYAVIVGEDEVASKQFTVKRLADAEQKKLSEAELIAYLKQGRAAQ